MSSSPLPQQLFRRIAAHHPSKSSTKRRASSPIAVSDSEDELPPALPIPARTKQQKRRKVDTRPESDSDCVVVPTRTKGKNRMKRNLDGDEMQQITKQFWVAENRDISQLPLSCWTASRKDEGQDFAYRVDLKDDSREWQDSKKNDQKMQMTRHISGSRAMPISADGSQ
ncbi:hypothetical protein B0H13DRAFT_2372465 [Mycena leptocephala]|nr:hypothetical protein B0H13DRAFT_2372465 [Mycena leptocephala]